MKKVSHQKHPIIWWFLQIVPPLLLLPLAVMPPDMGSALLWLIGFIAVLVSLGTIFRIIVALVGKVGGDRSFTELTRPLLTIVVMGLALLSLRISSAEAEGFARQTAEEIQTRVDAEGICPQGIDGWVDVGTNAWGTRAGWLATYRIIYQHQNERQEFVVILRRKIGRQSWFMGGVGQRLRREER